VVRGGPSALGRHKNESLNDIELEPGGAQIESEKRGFRAVCEQGYSWEVACWTKLDGAA
jgi:hypothetical protein